MNLKFQQITWIKRGPSHYVTLTPQTACAVTTLPGSMELEIGVTLSDLALGKHYTCYCILYAFSFSIFFYGHPLFPRMLLTYPIN